ncbi:MAG: hypothetical protein KKE23_02670 [Nanoarchaeota archaeon]|nr:hypothetical protein [Nanoarchaeota archaeon]
MAFFKKKKDVGELKLPELPISASFPELPREEESSMPSLPSLPQLKPMPQLPQLPQFSQPQAQKMPQFSLAMPEREMPSPKPMIMEMGGERKMPGTSPVFVKMDKFKDAMANFEVIKKKLQESSSLLEKIRETRAKEEEELNEWAEELNIIKEKLLQIDKKIFSNID